jgi:hypothetical protein
MHLKIFLYLKLLYDFQYEQQNEHKNRKKCLHIYMYILQL